MHHLRSVKALQWVFPFTIWIVMVVQAVAAPLSPTEPTARGKNSELPSSERPTLYRSMSEHLDASIQLNAGLRFDELDWSIAGKADGTDPNVRSELKWKDVLSHQLTLSGRLLVHRHLYLRGRAGMAWIRNGEVRDSDYDGDNRTQEYSRSISDTDDDELYDLSAGGGYAFHFLENRLFFAPMIGMSLHYQNFRITDGYQVISEKPGLTPDIGPLDSRLDSTYCTRCMGLWIGCDLRYTMAERPTQVPPIEWELNLVYHFWGDYEADADWNLRQDLAHPKSFKHEADARGGSVTATCHIPIHPLVRINLSASYTRWTTDQGDATMYKVNLPPRTSRLNKVTWESRSIMMGFDCRFF